MSQFILSQNVSISRLIVVIYLTYPLTCHLSTPSFMQGDFYPNRAPWTTWPLKLLFNMGVCVVKHS